MQKKLLLIFFLFFSKYTNAESCFWKLNSSSAELKWVAYKFTEKAPVEGKLADVKISGIRGNAPDLKMLLSAISFTADGMSVESGNQSRDNNLKNFFFKKVKNASQISGKVTSVLDDKLTVKLKVNDIEKDVIFTYAVDENSHLLALANIDMLDFAMTDAFNSIHEKCKDLHTGKDGKAKTWSEVALKASISVQKTCK